MSLGSRTFSAADPRELLKSSITFLAQLPSRLGRAASSACLASRASPPSSGALG